MTKIDVKIQENEGLVRKIVSSCHIVENAPDYEDAVDAGRRGLWNAVETYDASLDTTFSTYAYKCIKNELCRYFKSESKKSRPPTISMDTTIVGMTKSGNEITLAELLPSEDDITEKIENEDRFEGIVNTVLNMDALERRIMLYVMGGKKQSDIAEILGYKHSNMKMKIKAIREGMPALFVNPPEAQVKLRVISDSFVLVTPKGTLNMEKLRELPVMATAYEGELVEIAFPASFETFSHIADLLQSPGKEAKKTDVVREYISKLEKFKTEQILNQFPNISACTVRAIIKKARADGLITLIHAKKGIYIVNKKN